MKNCKLLFFIAAICFSPVWLGAKQITREAAQKVAEAQVQLRSQLRSGQSPTLNLIHVETAATKSVGGLKATSAAPGDVLYYVYNVGDKGFVIVSGDDIAVPVLGYSDSGTYDPDNLAPNFVYYIGCLANEIKEAIAHNLPQSDKTKAQWEAYLSGNTASLRMASDPGVPATPLLNEEGIKWDQFQPFNHLLNFNGTQTVTGCVATAMAQIMRFHKYPVRGTGIIDSYTTKKLGISIPQKDLSVDSYNWGIMLPFYPTNTYTGTSGEDAVATLMYDCGISVRMDYNTAANGGSAANSWAAGSALMHNFSYNNSLNFKQRKFYSDVDWDAMLKSQIDKRQPVLYSGQDTNGQGGHSFVCDGYDDTGKFHFNWGWSGRGSGTNDDVYFPTTALDPQTSEGYKFNNGQDILIDIIPQSGGTNSYEIALYASSSPAFSPSPNQVNYNDYFSITALYYYNYGFSPFNGNFGFALYDNQNNVVYSNTSTSYTNIPAFDGQFYHGTGWSWSGKIPSSVPPGIYVMKPIAAVNTNTIPVQLPVGFTAPTLTVKGVVLDNTSLNMVIGDHAQLTPTYYLSSTPTGATWTSSKPDVATVDGNGLITAVKAGTTTITVLVTDVDMSSGTPISTSYSAICDVTVSNPPAFVWQGTYSPDWNTAANWVGGKLPSTTDIVKIPGPAEVNYFPDLNYVPANVTVATATPGPGSDTGSPAAPVATVSEIHFAPGAELGGQDRLSYTKAFVQLDFNAPASRNRWWMLTNPLQQMFAGDFLFGGSPGVAIQSFVAGTDGLNAWKTFTDGFGHQFGQGDCFEIWLGTTVKPNQGLSVSSGIITLPYFEDPAQVAVHPTHIYDPATKKSTFNNGTTSPIISVDRDPIAAYKLADGIVTKNLIFGKGTDQYYYAATGNPFMSSISFSKLQSFNSSLISGGSYWVWVGPATSSTPTPGGYAIYNAATGKTVGNPNFGNLNDTIPPMQSFIVERNATSTGALITFNIANINATRKNKSTVGLREAAQSNDLLEITASTPQSAFCAVIASREGGSLMFNNLDSRKIFTDINVSPDIYMLKQSANNGMVAVAADVLNDIKEDVVIPLGISTAYEGSITFTFAGMDTYNARIFLIDNAAPDKKEIELTGKAKYDYTFSYTPEKVNDTAVRNESRFAVRLSPTGVTGIESAAANNILVFSRGAGTVQAISGEVIKQITVIDMQGRKIHDNPSVSANEYTVTGLAAGVYVVKAVTGNEVKTTKVIVK